MLAVVLLSGCDRLSDEDSVISTGGNLVFLDSHKVDVEEPSGLSLSMDGESLWTISDSNGGAYRISLTGEVLERFQTPYGDLEGIAVMDASQFAFIPERNRTVVVARKDGTIVEKADLPIEGRNNKGPEALAYDQIAQQFHIVRERPGCWITLNREFEMIADRKLKFARDYSGVSYDPERRHLWVMSDESESIHVIGADNQIEASFFIEIEQMEGLAIDHEARRLYIISEALSRLFIFKFDLAG